MQLMSLCKSLEAKVEVPFEVDFGCLRADRLGPDFLVVDDLDEPAAPPAAAAGGGAAGGTAINFNPGTHSLLARLVVQLVFLNRGTSC